MSKTVLRVAATLASSNPTAYSVVDPEHVIVTEEDIESAEEVSLQKALWDLNKTADIDSLVDRVTATEGDIDGLTDRVIAAEGDIDNLLAWQTTAQTLITNNGSAITNNKSAQDKKNTELEEAIATVSKQEGPAGNGISKVAKLSSTGLVDTYLITYTKSDPTTFTVTNGSSGVTPTIKAASGSNIGVVGTPSVTANTSGTTTTFTFNYLKGATGAAGAKGDKGDKGADGAAGSSPTAAAVATALKNLLG